MGREEKARDFHAHGSSCSQAVYATYADLLGLDTVKAKRESSTWAGGAKVYCGAVYSSFQIINNVFSKDKKQQKAATEEFKRLYVEENGCLDCSQLLSARSKNQKSCRDYIGSAARVLDQVLQKY